MVERVATRIYRIMEKQEHGSPRMKRVSRSTVSRIRITGTRLPAGHGHGRDCGHLYERLVCYGSFFYDSNVQGVDNIFSWNIFPRFNILEAKKGKNTVQYLDSTNMFYEYINEVVEFLERKKFDIIKLKLRMLLLHI